MERDAVIQYAVGFTALLMATATLAATNGSYQHTVTAGQRIQIGNERSWSEACESTGVIISFAERPQHGSITMDRVPSKIPQRGEDCDGRSVTATRVFYAARRGYQGPDHVSWDAVYGNGQARHVDVDLSIVSDPHQ